MEHGGMHQSCVGCAGTTGSNLAHLDPQKLVQTERAPVEVVYSSEEALITCLLNVVTFQTKGSKSKGTLPRFSPKVRLPV